MAEDNDMCPYFGFPLDPQDDPPAVQIHLVRHATAFTRSQTAQDILRPLDPNGLAQATMIARHLGSAPIVRILSSPATRCEQTVKPLADLVGLPVEVCDDLWEGHWDGRALNLVNQLARSGPGDIVLCSHGDVIPSVLNGLQSQGMTPAKSVGIAKGSVWTLDISNDAVQSCSYRPIRVEVST